MSENLNLKKTIVLPDPSDATKTKEFNINAVYSDEAGKVVQKLTLMPSLAIDPNLKATKELTGDFDGSKEKEVLYVPATGGTFNGIVHVYDKDRGYGLGTEENPIKDSEVLNYKQIDTIVSNLKGNPLWTWDAAGSGRTAMTGGYQDAKIYGLNTVIGKVEDLPVFEAYSSGQAHNLYVTPDSYDNAYITYGTYKDAYFNQAYDDIKGSITKLVFPNTYVDKSTGEKKSVEKIRYNEFTANTSQSYGFTNIVTVHINPGITEIDNNAFSGCEKLTSVAIPNSVTRIGLNTFSGCTSLTNVVLGSHISTIDAGAFSKCINLTSIAICNSSVKIVKAKKVGSTNYLDAFSDCSALTKIYFKGSPEEWSALVDNADLAPDNPLRSATVVTISDTAFPFLYICKGPKGEDTSLTSNKMFLKLPDEDLVEISKGAARLERRDSKTSGNVDYFTYDVLAAVIAGINSRITALGSKALALPETLKVYDSETTAVVNIPTKIANEFISTDSDKALLVEETDVPSVLDLAQDIDDLKVELLDGVAGNYATKTVGGISAGSQIDGDITVSGLLKTILGIKDGVAPSGFSFSISPSSITANLNTTSQSITASWKVSNGGTYTGNYMPTIGGKSGTATTSKSGTISGITVTFTEANTSKSVSGSVGYAEAAGFSADTLTSSATLTIKRKCYYGPSTGTLSSAELTSKSNWIVNQSTVINNDYFVIQYPKVWGLLSSITDNDTGYEAIANSETFNKTPTEVTKNGGTYYQYKTNNKLSGKLSFKINS